MGSCILNILLIGGLVALIHPVLVPRIGFVDLLMLCGFGIVLLPICLRGPNRVTRAEGVFLLLVYLGYLTWRGLKLAASDHGVPGN